jgi:hypothetical protein
MSDTIMKPQRISLEKARKIALPVLLAGFNKRGKIRSTAEESHRTLEKVARDRRCSSRPHLSSI